jgi:hypothetical protein
MILLLTLFACRTPGHTGTDDTDSAAPDDSAPDTDSGAVTVTPGTADKLVVIVLDGVRIQDSFGDGTALDGTASTTILPTVRETLLPLGALVSPAVQTGATSTAPGHCDLLAGRNVPHGHFNIQSAEGVGDYIPEWPTFIQAFLAASPGRRALVTGDTPHTEGLVSTLYPGADGVADFENLAVGGIATENDTNVIDGLITHLQTDAPDFALANLHAADTFGHLAEADAYLDAVKKSDANILRVWNAIQSLPAYADHTLLVVTSDHGRHSTTGADAWGGHGDVCTGCRQVPILLVGPGVAQGVTVATPYALIDLAPTVAHLLGTPMPFAEGLVMSDLLAPTDTPAARSGFVELSGSATAAELLPEPAHRSRVVVDGVELSDPLALEARGPVALEARGSGEGALVCWREIAAAGTDYWSWHAACSESVAGTWTATDYPQANVDPWWSPALAEVGDETWTAWVDNAGGGVPKDDEPPQPLPVARRVNGVWRQSATSALTYFPSTPALAGIGTDEAILAYAGSDDAVRGRYTRKIRVHHLVWRSGTRDPTWTLPTTFDLSADGVGRQERPALHTEGLAGALAFLGYGHGLTAVYAATTADGGATWSAATRISGDERVLPEIAPVWDAAGRLWWAALGDDDAAELCSASPSAGDTASPAVTCSPVGSDRIGGLAASGAGVRVSIDAGVGEWAVTTAD